DDELPHVTVQLPIFNESTVAARLVRRVAALDYPRDRLEIQVLDDSTDDTAAITCAEVDALRASGVRATWLHRTDRRGYKAGALAAGLERATGELVAIFDADFLPEPDFLRALVGHFRDARVGMVQARWTHLNRTASLLTRVQALMLDSHHLCENRARFGSGLYFNFSGTAGIWRRAAIEDAGGWQHDTLTEDLDLSYRAQLRGWRCIYRPDVTAPAELPEEIAAVRAQQHRWAKGTVQTARKLLGRVWRAPVGLGQKVEAFFHLTPHCAYPLMLLLSLLLLPMMLFFEGGGLGGLMLVDLPVCVVPLGSLAGFYMHAESAQGRPRRKALALLPVIIALGAGLAPHLGRAVLEGARQRGGEFVRTPKRGDAGGRYRARLGLPVAELGLGLLSLATTVASVARGHYLATPFALLVACGYLFVAALMLGEARARRRVRGAEGPAAVAPASASPAAVAARRADSVTELAA
ncbi:MAG: glycosyltransferase, partial [Polyangiaceae bacterium]|nr:glycosyltransferase [Polyangiaceae bacterium]